MYGGCEKAVWTVWGHCLDSVGRLPGEWGNVVRKVLGILSGGCGKDVCRVWEDCMEGVGRLSRRCGKVNWMVWEGSLDGVGKLCVSLSRGCSVWRVGEGCRGGGGDYLDGVGTQSHMCGRLS